jgi:hypothetical protein
VSTTVRKAIYGTLAGGALDGMLGTPAPGFTHAIYHDPAPQGASHPFIVFARMSGVPTQAFHDPSAYEEDVWQVKAIDYVSRGGTISAAEAIETIGDRIKNLLNDAPLSLAGTLVCTALRRQSDIDYSEVSEGVVYRHYGSLFRVTYTHT